MTLLFVGTGAADWDWVNFPPGTRGSTSTLVDGHCLIDAGPTVVAALERCDVPLESISHILVTHSHPDHFRPETIAAIAAARGGDLDVWASPQAIRALTGIDSISHELHQGANFSCGALSVTALPANHFTGDMNEQAFHFLLQSEDVSLLYALDGAWMLSKGYDILGKALAGRALDAVVWDATCGPATDNWRFASHNDIAMIDRLRASMLNCGLVSASTMHILDHIARTLWPEDASGREAIAQEHGAILAEDGLALDIS